MVEESVEIPTFWSQIIAPGSGHGIVYPYESILSITNMCIPEIPENKDPIRLIAHIRTIQLDENGDIPEPEVAKSVETTSMIASFIPGEIEFLKTNIVFSALNVVTLENTGTVPIHLVGQLEAIEVEDIVIEEGDIQGDATPEEEEEEDEGDVQAKLLALSKKK